MPPAKAPPTIAATTSTARGRKSHMMAIYPLAKTRNGLRQLRLIEPLAQIGDRLEYRHRPRLLELFDREAAAQNRDRPHVSTPRRVHVPRGIPDHHGVFERAVHALKRRLDQVGLGLGLLDVGRGRPPVRERAGVEQI